MSKRKGWCNNMKWYEKSGRDGDVVISTRVRLARNIAGIPFPGTASAEQLRRVNDMVHDALCQTAAGKDLRRIKLDSLGSNEINSMVECHVISPEFAKNRPGRELLVSQDESVSIMLCEEDHIRLQIMGQGLQLAEAFDMADKLDTLLGQCLELAYDEKLGYLTACPTNLGTGLRVSAMMHLPAIEATGALKRISDSIGKLGLTIRGLYGEGSGSKGALYQISNRETLGVSEKDTIDKLSDMLGKIVEIERAERQKLMSKPEIADKVWRSLGILRTARMLSGDEFAGLFSAVRLGASTGELDGVDIGRLTCLFIESQPATLMLRCGRDMTAQERDSARAELVRKVLA